MPASITTIVPPAGLLPQTFLQEIGLGGIPTSHALDHFYGEARIAYANRFLQDIAKGRRPVNVAVQLRRSGKTSLLSHLWARIARDFPEAIRPIYLNGLQFSGEKNKEALYRWMLKEARIEVPKESRDSAEDLFWRGVEKLAERVSILFLFDEAYDIIKTDPRFFKRWRGLYEQGANLSMLFASFVEDRVLAATEMGEGGHTVSHSHSLNIAGRRTLPPFEKPDISAFLGDAWFGECREFAPNFLSFMLAVTDGNPFQLVKTAVQLGIYWSGESDHDLDLQRPFDPRILFEDRASLAEYFQTLGGISVYNVFSSNSPFAIIYKIFAWASLGEANVGKYLDAVLPAFFERRSLKISRNQLLSYNSRQKLGWNSSTDAEFRDVETYLHDIGWLKNEMGDDGAVYTVAASFPLLVLYGDRMGWPLPQVVALYLKAVEEGVVGI